MLQILATYRVKNNVTLDYFQVFIELGLIIICSIFIEQYNHSGRVNNFIVDKCEQVYSGDPELLPEVSRLINFAYMNSGTISFSFLISSITVLATLISIVML